MTATITPATCQSWRLYDPVSTPRPSTMAAPSPDATAIRPKAAHTPATTLSNDVGRKPASRTRTRRSLADSPIFMGGGVPITLRDETAVASSGGRDQHHADQRQAQTDCLAGAH